MLRWLVRLPGRRRVGIPSQRLDVADLVRCVPIVGCLLLTLTAAAAGQSLGRITGVVRTTVDAGAGARVVIRGNLGSATVADSTGHFVLPGVEPGTHTVVATLEGWNPGSALVSVVGGDTVVVLITLGTTQQLPEISVTAARVPSYYADSATGGTKFPVPLLDLPQDIAVVMPGVIADRHITTPAQLTNNVSGVIALAPSGLNDASYLFRGVPSSGFNTTLHDGFRDLGYDTRIDMSSVERVEFLKGPESVAYGAVGSLGGLANFISKQPLARRAGALTLSVDDNADTRATLDVGGPFTSSAALGYRLNAAVQQIRTFQDMSEGSYAFAVAPVIAWQPSSRMTLSLTSDYTQSRYRGNPFLPLYDGVFDAAGIELLRRAGRPALRRAVLLAPRDTDLPAAR